MNTTKQARSILSNLLIACALLLTPQLAHAGDQSPWETIARYPDDVDAILVLDNPAGRILLDDSGIKTRDALAQIGLFTETERAWASLAKSFNLKPDQAIKALMSKRVVLLWDNVAVKANDPFSLAAAADNRWVLVAEVDPDFVARVRKYLKPVARRIHNSKPVYSIEQGRYQLVVIDGKGQENTPRMIVAPKSGARLLDRVLDSMLIQGANNAPRSHLGERSAKIHARIDDGWVIAGAVALDHFADQFPANQEQPRAVLSVVVRADEQSWKISLASDIQLDLPEEHDAPVALLAAVGGDALLAMANIGSFTIEGSSAFLGLNLAYSSDSAHDPAPPGGSLVLFTPSIADQPDQAPSAVMVLVSATENAKAVDQAMESILADAESGLAPQFEGCFPHAIRTQTKPLPNQDSDDWLGDAIKVSWICRTGRTRNEMVLAIGPQSAQTAQRVRWIVEAANTLDAIPNTHSELGVLSRGFVRPKPFADLMLDDQPGLISSLTDSIERIGWDLRRAPFGIAGSVEFNWASRPQAGQLGHK